MDINREEIKYDRIESKEIRGLNIRNLITIILATITIVSTVLMTKVSIENQIAQIRNDQLTYNKINDMSFKMYDTRLQYMQVEIDNIDKKIEEMVDHLNK